MACRAVLFALNDADVVRLLAANSDRAVRQMVHNIESRWDTEWLCALDKAWDGLHRCFTDGEIAFDNGTYPLNHAILGGRQLHQGEEYIAALVRSAQVKDVAQALQSLDDDEMERRYWRINQENYGFAPEQLCEEDMDYVLGWFEELQPFYAKAAAAERAVLFTVSQ